MKCPKCKSEMRHIKARKKDDLGKTIFVCPGGCAKWEEKRRERLDRCQSVPNV